MRIVFDQVRLAPNAVLSVCSLCRAVVLPTKDDEAIHAESHGGKPADHEVEGEIKVDTPSFEGTVASAGGGTVTIIVDRDVEYYPREGDRALVAYTEPSDRERVMSFRTVRVRKGEWTEREVKARMTLVQQAHRYRENPLMAEGLMLAIHTLDGNRPPPIEETMAWLVNRQKLVEHNAHGLSWELWPTSNFDRKRYEEAKRALG